MLSINLGVDTKSKPDDAKSSPGRCKISSDAKSNSSCHISVWCSQGIVVLAGVHGSVPKLLTVSDTVQSHAGCMYRPPGMSRHPMVLSRGE